MASNSQNDTVFGLQTEPDPADELELHPLTGATGASSSSAPSPSVAARAREYAGGSTVSEVAAEAASGAFQCRFGLFCAVTATMCAFGVGLVLGQRRVVPAAVVPPPAAAPLPTSAPFPAPGPPASAPLPTPAPSQPAPPPPPKQAPRPAPAPPPATPAPPPSTTSSTAAPLEPEPTPAPAPPPPPPPAPLQPGQALPPVSTYTASGGGILNFKELCVLPGEWVEDVLAGRAQYKKELDDCVSATNSVHRRRARHRRLRNFDSTVSVEAEERRLDASSRMFEAALRDAAEYAEGAGRDSFLGDAQDFEELDEARDGRRLEDDAWYTLGGEEHMVAVEEGQAVGEGMYPLEECQANCRSTPGCNSIAFCRDDKNHCYFKAGKYKGLEDVTHHDVCTTYYYGPKADRSKLPKKKPAPAPGAPGSAEPEIPSSMPDWKWLTPPSSFASEAEAEPWLTTWRCIEAFGSRYDGVFHTCHFHNLYVESNRRNEFASVVHTLQGRSANPSASELMNMKFSLNVASSFGPVSPRLRVVEHRNVDEFAKALAKGPLTDQAGLSQLLAPVYYFNIGHGIWDGVYPGFVSLFQLGLHDRPFRPVLLSPWEPGVVNQLPGMYSHVEETIGSIGLVPSMRMGWVTYGGEGEKPIVHRFEEAVFGVGSNSQKIDANVNTSLGACRELDACRAFRNRVYWSQGLPQPPPARRTGPFRVILIANKRFEMQGVTNDLNRMKEDGDARVADFDFKFVSWSPSATKDSMQTGNFHRHMEIISSTDIHISGGGTGQMYQNFLPDGAVHIALGSPSSTNQGYMEEHMTEGAPYLHGLYYPRRHEGDPGLSAMTLIPLLLKAKEKLQKGLDAAVPVGVNLSPPLQVFKAYNHLAHADLAKEHSEPMSSGHLMQRDLQAETFMGNNWPEEFVYLEQRRDRDFDKCLLSTLRSSFDHRFPESGVHGQGGWFGTSGQLQSP